MKKIKPQSLVTILAILFLSGLFFVPQIAHAQNLHADLTMGGNDATSWIFTIWKIALGLANVFVVLILLFLAIVNIVHLQYDTYAIKKTLPLLIGGIIAANFSLLISRMIVDAAQVLTYTFVGNDTQLLFQNYMCAIGLHDGPLNTMNNAAAFTFFTNPGIALFPFVIIIIFGFVILIAILILSFLLLIRKFVIFMLVAVSPVTFILYAFPPTQGLFKQWWSWFFRWVFMGPVIMFLVWAASQIGATNCKSFSVSSLFGVVLVTYLAAIVPFKLGGALMGAWSNLGKKAASPATNAAKKEYDYRKENLGLRANRWINEKTPFGQLRARRREEKQTLEEELKGSEALASSKLAERERARFMLRRRRAQEGNESLEAQGLEITNKIEAGERIESLSERDYKSITNEINPEEIARKYMNSSNKINIAKSALTKRRDIDINIAALRDLRNHNMVVAKMKDDLAAKGAAAIAGTDGISVNRYDTEGNMKLAAGATGNELFTYADMVNTSADFRAKAKAAHNVADQKKMDDIAQEYENAAKKYRTDNSDKYDYDVILDRNTSGRRFKEINPRIVEEADITFKSSTGESVVKDFDKIEGFGTAEYRGDKVAAERALVGKWEENEDTANFAAAQQIRAVDMFMTQGVRSGDFEGMQALHGFVNRLNDAHLTGAAATGKRYKLDTLNSALAKMNIDDADKMRDALAKRAGHVDWADAVSKGASDAVLEGADLEQLQVQGTGRVAQRERQFAQRVLATLHEDKNLGISASPAVAPTKVKPNAHPTK